MSFVQLQPYSYTKYPTVTRRISVNATLPVISAEPPGCSDLKPHPDVEDLAFPHGWRGYALKAAQRRRTCPGGNQNSGGPSGQPRRLVPPTGRPLK